MSGFRTALAGTLMLVVADSSPLIVLVNSLGAVPIAYFARGRR